MNYTPIIIYLIVFIDYLFIFSKTLPPLDIYFNMATGGVFQLITNDGKQDRMLMATQMLRNRLESIRAKRRADPSISDETPTLLDIERTHVLFTNAHFKPFVALGYEYNKVNAGSGTVQLGGEVQFSIPQFGDYEEMVPTGSCYMGCML